MNSLTEELKEEKFGLETQIADYEIKIDELNNDLKDQLSSKTSELNKVQNSQKEWERKYEKLQKQFE